MDTANLERVEILKGPASLLSGDRRDRRRHQLREQGAAHRTDRQRSLHRVRFVQGLPRGYGSGGSTTIDGLDYRFDVSAFATI